MKELANLSNRLYMIDNLKIILIYLVVLGHVFEKLGNPNSIWYNLIYIFHMPLFIFITGITFKKYILNNNYKKIILKTLYPYLFFNIIFRILGKNNSFIDFIFLPFYHLWFLISLFFWVFITNLIKNRSKKYVLIFSIVFSLLVGFLKISGYYLSNSRTITYFPFFLIGFYFKFEYLNILKKNKWILFLLTITLFLIYYFRFFTFEKELLWGHIKYYEIYSNEYIGFFKRVILFFSSVIFSIFFLILIPNKNYIITKYGEKTFDIYIYHVLFLEIIKRLCYSNTSYIQAIAITTFIIFNCIIYSKIKYKLYNLFKKKVFKI